MSDTLPDQVAADDEKVKTPAKTDDVQVPPEHPKFKNLCDDEEIVKQFRAIAKKKLEQYKSDREPYDSPDGVWAKASYMANCGINTALDDSTKDDTEADVGTTLYFRQIRALSSYLVSIYLSRKDPVKPVPIATEGAFASETEASVQARINTLLLRATAARDNMKLKVFEFANNICTFGNAIQWTRWNYSKIEVEDRVPVRDPQTGDISGYEFKTRELVVDNQPSTEYLSLDSLYADRSIGSLAKQQCFVFATQEDRGNLWGMERSGQVKNVDKITKAHEWKGAQGDGATQVQVIQDNQGVAEADDTQTGMIARYDVWMKAPIGKNKSGKYEWNIEKYPPVWYWGMFAGDIDTGPCLLLRDNYNRRKDKLPGEVIHLLPGPDNMLYHLSPSQITLGIYEELTTKKRQAIDNVTLQNRRPLVGIRGEVFSTVLTYAANSVIWVEKNDSLREMDVASNIGPLQFMLEYLEAESNKALGTDKPFMGEALGSRTSATEANNVYTRTMQPAMMLAQYVWTQSLQPMAETSIGLWGKYSLKDQVLEITGEPEPTRIKPAELFGDFDYEVVVVDEFVNDQIAAQNMNYLLQGGTAQPTFFQTVDPKKFWKRACEIYRFDTSMSQYMLPNKSGDAERLAKGENAILVEGKTWIDINPDDDDQAHVNVHDGYLLEFNGLEDQYESGLLDNLKQHSAKHKFRMKQQGAEQAVPSPAPSGNETPGEVSGNALAGPMGMNNAPGVGQ